MKKIITLSAAIVVMGSVAFAQTAQTTMQKPAANKMAMKSANSKMTSKTATKSSTPAKSAKMSKTHAAATK